MEKAVISSFIGQKYADYALQVNVLKGFSNN